MEKANIGVIGCGRISPQYLDNLVNKLGFCLEVSAVSDILPDAAEARASEYGISAASTPEEILEDPDIEIVVNLTVPAAHYETNMKILNAGKHLYTEKPIAVTREEGKEIIESGNALGLKVAGAPDTFLGAGLQTCRKLIDDGWIGTPLSAQGFIAMGPNVERYHKIGVGPMFDMGPYYITAMVSLFGPVSRVCGSTRTPFAVKMNPDTSAPDFGEPFTVDIPTVVSGILDFENGVIGSVTTTCEVFGYTPRLEIYGTEGILTCNDPNMFSGPVYVKRNGREVQEMPLTHYYDDRNRGVGVADMVYAIRNGREPRASGTLMYHVHDIMHAIHEASDNNTYVAIESAASRPTALPAGFKHDIFA